MRSAGLFDLQVNGFAGVDFNSAGLTADALDHALSAMLRSGVTQCLPTLITAAEADLASRASALDHAIRASRLGPVMVPGIHLEGPFLNPAAGYAGCHPHAAMVPPDPALLRRIMQGISTPIRLLTLAPEREGAISLIAWATSQRGTFSDGTSTSETSPGGARQAGASQDASQGGAFHGGIVTAMGHTAADQATVAQAAAAGLSLSTHLGNALPQPQPKFLNPMIAQLAEDRLHASFIADGIHIPPHALGVLLRAKGLERSILVTDATAAAAAPPGIYEFAGMRIEHAADGSVREPGSAVLAGSALRLDQAVRNVVRWGLADPAQAIAMASVRPARLMGGSFDLGTVEWDGQLMPRTVSIGGVTLTL